MIKGKKYIQQDSVIILATGKKDKAIVIKDPKNMWGVGYYAKDWNPEAFTEYLDDIVL